VQEEVIGIGLPPLEPLLASEVRRVGGVYPVYDHGYDDRLAAALAHVDQREGLVTLGRQGLFAHDNTHHALAMSFAAARCLSGDGAFDQLAWESACAGFAEHVVED
jgi:protoporphyrinogen oxidase